MPERRRSSRFSGNVFFNFQKIEKYELKKLAKTRGIVYNNKAVAEMAERSNAHDSKSCYGVTHTRVQIPFSAPYCGDKKDICPKKSDFIGLFSCLKACKSASKSVDVKRRFSDSDRTRTRTIEKYFI